MKARTRLGLLLVALAVFGALSGSQALVLCVAEGDHTRIETAIELLPCGAPLGLRTDAPATGPVEACTDTPLVVPAMGAAVERCQAVSLHLTLVPSALIRSHPITTPARALGPEAALADLLASLRSVVLVV